MKDLIERLEKATGPDRDIDHAIDRTITGEWHYYAPEFTASIDAALTLVPEGLHWHVMNEGEKRKPGFTEWNGWAGVYGAPMVGSECDSYASTPAIALCIAALRARLTVVSGGRDG